MADPSTPPPLALPSDDMWATLGIKVGNEVHGGQQSRVFAGILEGQQVVAKLVDSRFANASFHERVAMSMSLSELEAKVVGPIATHSGLVAELGEWFCVTYPFVDGTVPNVHSEVDVRTMARVAEPERYEQFRSWFVDEYRIASQRGVADELIDHAIGIRIAALGRWLAQPESAPVGIRNASSEWRATLTQFVEDQGD